MSYEYYERRIVNEEVPLNAILCLGTIDSWKLMSRNVDCDEFQLLFNVVFHN